LPRAWSSALPDAKYGRVRRPALRVAVLVLSVAAAWGWSGACTSVPTDPKAVFSLMVDTVPAPSVVAGDTMRDTLGNLLAIKATAYNVQGQTLPTSVLHFYSFDTTQLRFDTLGHPIGAPNGDGAPTFVVDASGLQSLPAPIQVVRRPDSLVHADTDSVTATMLSLAPGATNISVPLTVHLKHIPEGAGADSVTRSYWVSYHILYPAFAAGATGAVSDTALPIYVGSSAQAPTLLDTTDVNGLGTRVIVFNAAKLAALNDPTDSVVVVAIAQYRGLPVAGSPVHFAVHYTE
jgi:hypothetical protein